MKASRLYLITTKEAPTEAELISHKLMLRAGLIKRLSSGIYTWLPLGLKILRKIEAIIRDEMNKIGANEILMPSVQPAELWQESGRWDFYGKELLRIKDRHNRDFCFGPTHEEVIVDLIRNEISSYKQLPIIMYQIQTKFRDEVRPRFGIMRAREFIMKDAYSFHIDTASLNNTYNQVYQTYCNIFNRLGLKFRAVSADTGSIGGTNSHEFQVLADSGEDVIAYSDNSEYAANLELATALNSRNHREAPAQTMQKTATPTQKTCEEVAELLNVPLNTTVKSLVFEGLNDEPVLVLIRGDHELNQVKASKISQLKQPLTFINQEQIQKYFHCQPGFIGPIGFTGTIIVDNEVNFMSDFVCGANEDGYHLTGVNFGRDCKEPDLSLDIRNVLEGDITPDGLGKFKLCKGIEVGHIFQLGSKYSTSMKFDYLDNQGKNKTVEMGCYGIGVSRIIGAAIEQNHDERGIILPISIAPFSVIITPVNYNKSAIVKDITDKLYQELLDLKIDVLMDDRDQRLGAMLADSELLGIPYRILIGEKTLNNSQIELYTRVTNTTELVNMSDIVPFVDKLIKGS